MNYTVRHIALVVPDLRAAEEYYQQLFDMTIVTREAPLADGLWYALPHDKRWENAVEAGIDLAMVALRKDNLVLALFQGVAAPGQVFAIGLYVAEAEIGRIRDRMPPDAIILDDKPDSLGFIDRYRINWQISTPGSEFQGSGDITGRWIPL
jgi:catechol 2,3-dioxygenase-like lactoylglutathione lyase family enzyme